MPTIKELGNLTADELGGRILHNPCNQQKMRQVVQEIAQAFTRLGNVDIPATANASSALPTSPTLIVSTCSTTWQDGSPPFADMVDSARVYLPRTRSGDPNVQVGDTVVYALDSSGTAWATSDYMDDKIGTIKMWDGSSPMPTGWAEMLAAEGYIVAFARTVGVEAQIQTGLSGGGVLGGTIEGGSTGTGYANVTAEGSGDIGTDTKTVGVTVAGSGPLMTGYTKSGIGPGSVTEPTNLSVTPSDSNVSGGASGSIIASLDMTNFEAETVADHTHAISWTSGEYLIEGTGYLKATETGPDGGHSHGIGLASGADPWSVTIEYVVTIADSSHYHTVTPDPHKHDLIEPNDGKGHRHTVVSHTHVGSTTEHSHVFPSHSHDMIPHGHVHPIDAISITVTMLDHQHTPGKPERYTVIPIIRIH